MLISQTTSRFSFPFSFNQESDFKKDAVQLAQQIDEENAMEKSMQGKIEQLEVTL